ncbi:exopolygalacturonase B [Aspergillus japonicus CBS 114.51]|uniref:Exopolygalacturonase B n=2 Tax=Aspergillus TaxID=5052 RepID=A0A2V5HMI7_ASPV1|nr:exopolygalacturonase B [Aspergillus japonicus CBS 114.51]PYI17430.1 exopolygalacturonase B [Aspergillus violaceofuscus CBS 115571]RAH85423.1 exopolygalacturonase B [Aspergillus japonicus CBS 114.51]
MLSRALTCIAGISSLIAPTFGLSDTTKSGRARATCLVPAGNSTAVDDVPAILDALTTCGNGGRVSFSNTTYHINSVMNTTWLNDVEIDLQGTLLWSTNISYWLANSLDVGYQNQSTAWILGGKDIVFDGHGYGTFNGSGPVWYSYTSGVSNYPRRPHQLTVTAQDSTFKGLRFVQSQMWTMSIIYSENLLFDSIYVNNLNDNGGSSRNTDGANTIRSNGITFTNWQVVNGDDSISLKGNSTDITIADSTFSTGLGISIGSIGQYLNEFETVENVRVSNCTYQKTTHAVYVKTWTGDQVGYPPNGGGGGLGYISDVTATDLSLNNLKGTPFTVSQCTTFSGASGNCTNSKFQVRDLYFSDVSGTLPSTDVISFQCSAVAPCENITVEDVSLRVTGSSTAADDYLCGNVEGTVGFNCTGEVCVGSSATGGC